MILFYQGMGQTAKSWDGDRGPFKCGPISNMNHPATQCLMAFPPPKINHTRPAVSHDEQDERVLGQDRRYMEEQDLYLF